MTDPLLLDHRRWLGYAQPVGLVVAALYELLHGFQAADAQTNGVLLDEWAKRDPDQVYSFAQTRRSLSDPARLFQQPARTRRQPADCRG